MATSSKNTSRKSPSKKTVVNKSNTVDTVQDQAVQVKKESLTQDTSVPVRCNLKNNSGIQDGVLIYRNDSTGARYIWHDYGDVCYIPFRELVIMKGKQPRFFDDGWISIDNYLDFNLANEVITALGVEDTMGYMKGKQFDTIADILRIEDSIEFEKEFRSMPDTLKPMIAKTAKDMVNSGELKDINILLAIRKVYPSFTI